MRKCAGSYDRLASGNGTASRLGYEFGEPRQHGQIHIAARRMKAIQSSGNLLQCRIAGAFSQAQHAYAGVGCSAANCRERIRGCESEVVVPMKLQLNADGIT